MLQQTKMHHSLFSPHVLVKKHESLLDGKSISVLMFQNGTTYGVAVINQSGIAVAPDFSSERNTTLRTHASNIKDIIDWVDLSTADQRYVELVKNNGYTRPLSAGGKDGLVLSLIQGGRA